MRTGLKHLEQKHPPSGIRHSQLWQSSRQTSDLGFGLLQRLIDKEIRCHGVEWDIARFWRRGATLRSLWQALGAIDVCSLFQMPERNAADCAWFRRIIEDQMLALVRRATLSGYMTIITVINFIRTWHNASDHSALECFLSTQRVHKQVVYLERRWKACKWFGKWMQMMHLSQLRTVKVWFHLVWLRVI